MATKRTRIAFVEDSKIFAPDEIEKVLKISVNPSMTIGNNKGIYYYNIPCSFDIETTSFYIDENGETVSESIPCYMLESCNEPDYRGNVLFINVE